MKQMILKTIILISILAVPVSSMANGQMGVSVVVPMPPPVVIAGPVQVVVIPHTYIYAVPDVDVDIFFFGGWWWRPFQGRWYRSHNYHSGWAYYGNTPDFYRHVPSRWRDDYRQNRWQGRQWEHQRIAVQTVEKDWNRWEKDRHWEKQNNWGVHDGTPEQKNRQQSAPNQQQHVREQNHGQRVQGHKQDIKRQTQTVRVREQQRYEADPKQYRNEEKYRPSQPQHSSPVQKNYDKKRNK